MTLLNVISSMDPKGGGTSQAIRHNTPELMRLGWSCEVVTLDASSAEYLGQDTFPVHALGPCRTSWAYSSRLRVWLRQNLPRFDRVLVHGLWQYPAVVARQECRRAGKPYYIMPHGMLDPWFQRDPSRRAKSLRNEIYWRLLENRTVRDAAAMLFTCEEELRLARTTFSGYFPKRELNVGFGIQAPPPADPKQKAAFLAECPALARRPYLLFLSRIHPKKGIDLLLRAYFKYAQDNAARKTSLSALVVAGPLDSSYAREIQSLAANLLTAFFTANAHLNRNDVSAPAIYFPGMLQNDAKWGAFYGCESFILPSHQENFGIAVVEALACGKPVFITDQVNIWREIVTSGGGCARPDTPEGIQALIGDAFSKETVQLCQGAARQVFETHFTITSAARRLADALGQQVSLLPSKVRAKKSVRLIGSKPRAL